MDESLEASVRVHDLVTTRTADQRLRARANIRNQSDDPLHLLIRTIFKDEHGNFVGTRSPWQTHMIEPRVTYEYDDAASSLDAVDYVIEINRGARH